MVPFASYVKTALLSWSVVVMLSYNFFLIFKMYIELYGSPDSEKQDKNIPDKIHLRVRHLSGSHFLAGDNKMKTYRQPVTDFRDFKFDRFTISNEGKCRKAKQEGRSSCKAELNRNNIHMVLLLQPCHLNPRTYKKGEGWLSLCPPPAPLRLFWVFFFQEDKTSAPDVFSSCSFILRAHFETSLVMVSYYGYDVIGSRCSSHLWVKMNIFSPSFNNKSKACGWNDAKGFICLFYMRSTKISIYCGFNLISNSWSNPRWRPRWRPLLLSSQAKSFWNTATYQNIRGRVPLIPSPPPVPQWGYEVAFTSEG